VFCAPPLPLALPPSLYPVSCFPGSCVIDFEPRPDFGAEQESLLQALAALVVHVSKQYSTVLYCTLCSLLCTEVWRTSVQQQYLGPGCGTLRTSVSCLSTHSLSGCKELSAFCFFLWGCVVSGAGKAHARDGAAAVAGGEV